MKIITKIALLGALVISASSCRLDLYPTDAIENEQAFSTFSDAQKISNGMNFRFRQTIYGQYDFSAEVQTDMFNASIENGNRNNNPHTMSANFTSSDYNIRDLWRQLYLSILSSNNFLSGIDNVTLGDGEAEKVAVMKGNAHFYRAFYYHKLVRYYCQPYDVNNAANTLGVPLVLEYNISEKPARATMAAVYTQIIADLNAAEANLASVGGKINSETPTIDAVYALKARVYLFMKNYPEAAKYADKVINSSAAYKLCTTEAEMTSEWLNDNGTEDIMQLFASLSEFGTSPQGASSNPDTRLAMSIYLGFNGSTSKYTPDFIPTKTCLEMYEAGDIRYKSWFKEYTCAFSGADVNLTLFNKYPGNPKLYDAVTNYAHKPKVFRVAEMYLIAAEAYLQSNPALALARLNSLQTARGASTTAATDATVRAEWAKEMIGEGARLDCMKRWNVGFTNRVPQNTSVTQQGQGFNIIDVQPGRFHFVWAIPDDDMQTNASLKGQQNPGW